MVSILASRECYRDEYWRKHDPILDDRLLWRAQTFRHTVHLLPGQTILERGRGGLHFTRSHLSVSRKAAKLETIRFWTRASKNLPMFKPAAEIFRLRLSSAHPSPV